MAREVICLITAGPCGEIGADSPAGHGLPALQDTPTDQPLDMEYASYEDLRRSAKHLVERVDTLPLFLAVP